MARLQSCIRPFFNTRPGFSGKNANQEYQKQVHEGKEKSPWSVLTSSPVIQKKKLKPNTGRITSRKWFAIQTRAILIKMKTVTTVNNARSTIT
jgi:hypothetical protein